jgi:hypothetical protein
VASGSPLRTQSPIYVEDSVLEHATSVDTIPERQDDERLSKWLESLDPDDLGKYKM